MTKIPYKTHRLDARVHHLKLKTQMDVLEFIPARDEDDDDDDTTDHRRTSQSFHQSDFVF